MSRRSRGHAEANHPLPQITRSRRERRDGHALDLAHLRAVLHETRTMRVAPQAPPLAWLGLSAGTLGELTVAAQSLELHQRLVGDDEAAPQHRSRVRLRELAATQVQLLGGALRAHPDGVRPAPPHCERLTRRVALAALDHPEARAGLLTLTSVIARDVGAAVGDPELRQDFCAVALGHALALFALVEAPLRT